MAIQVTCPACSQPFTLATPGEPTRCPHCGKELGRIAQLSQCLEQWYSPRKFRVDVVRPSVHYLLERLWTADGQGERLYQGISPRYTNYDVFRNMVTRVVARGVDEGWVTLHFPEDPLAEDPVYRLEFKDSERFADEVAKLFPEVNWDETIEVPAGDLPEETQRSKVGY